MSYLPTRSYVQPLEARRLLSLTPVGEPVDLPPFPDEPYGSSYVDVAVAGDGSFVVANSIMYGESRTENLSPRISVTRYAADGTVIYGPVEVRETYIMFTNLSVSTDADGDAVVVYWGRESEQTTNWHAYYNLISRDGIVRPPVMLDESVPSALAVSMDASGGFFIGGSQKPTDRNGSEVMIQSFDANGVARAPAFVAIDAGPARSYFEIEALPDGSGAVFAYVQGTTPTLTYGRVSTTARLGKARYVAGINPYYFTATPSVALHADGSFVVAYQREGVRSGVLGLRPYAAYAIRCDAAGNPLGPEIELGAGLPGEGLGKRIKDPSIDALRDGGFVAAFAQSTGDSELIVYARRFGPDGTPEPAQRIEVTSNGGFDPVQDPAIGANDAGYVVVMWEPSRSANARFQRLRADSPFRDSSERYVIGTDGADHIIVERVRGNLFINVNGAVQRLDADDVRFLSISGLGGDDDIDNATALPSTIHGGDGADTIWGGVGPDRIRGFGGDDVLRGGDGNDELLGDSGSDVVSGGDGDDNVQGDVGEDTLTGGSGNDVLLGQRGSDSLYGEAGNDVLFGGDADDYLEGGAGHDELYGQGGRDALFGLSGNDRLFADDGAADTVRGGPGDDSADVDDEDDVLAVEAVS